MRSKTFWIIIIILAVAGGGYAAYQTWLVPEAEAEVAAVMQTATVTMGDLSITASGTGVLVAASEAKLAFSSGGTLEELLVAVGDSVNAGDVLAWMDDAAARQAVAEAELQVIHAEQSLALTTAQSEFNIAQAQANLDTAQSDLDDLLNWEADVDDVALAEANLTSAQATYQNTLAKAGVDQTVSSRVSLDQAISNLANAQENYTSALNPERDWEKNIEDARASAADSLLRAQQNLEIAQTNYNLSTINSTLGDIQSAKAKMLSSQSALDALQTPPETAQITAAQIKVQQTELALAQAELDLMDLGEGKTAVTREAELALEQAQLKLTSAQETLEGTLLVAPFAGTVTAVNAAVGDTVNGAVVVVADLMMPVVQFWVEESDLNNIAAGNPVNIVFEALPDLTYTGAIFQVDPVLVTVSNTPAVQAWASIDTSVHPVNLLGDMNVEVEIVAGEARNALLVPVQALRELGAGQYAVFVVTANEELEMRRIEVGLMDFVNAVVISGLERGEVVSLGETTTSSSNPTTSQTQSEASPSGIGFMMGGRP